jgi:hypothetical protein
MLASPVAPKVAITHDITISQRTNQELCILYETKSSAFKDAISMSDSSVAAMLSAKMTVLVVDVTM